MAMTHMISLQNVTRLYGTVLGVNDITLELPRGAYGLQIGRAHV